MLVQVLLPSAECPARGVLPGAFDAILDHIVGNDSVKPIFKASMKYLHLVYEVSASSVLLHHLCCCCKMVTVRWAGGWSALGCGG